MPHKSLHLLGVVLLIVFAFPVAVESRFIRRAFLFIT